MDEDDEPLKTKSLYGLAGEMFQGLHELGVCASTSKTVESCLCERCVKAKRSFFRGPGEPLNSDQTMEN